MIVGRDILRWRQSYKELPRDGDESSTPAQSRKVNLPNE